jgi:hypothetical protein
LYILLSFIRLSRFVCFPGSLAIFACLFWVDVVAKLW